MNFRVIRVIRAIRAIRVIRIRSLLGLLGKFKTQLKKELTTDLIAPQPEFPPSLTFLPNLAAFPVSLSSHSHFPA